MNQDQSQKGFSLVAVLALALLATFAAFAVLRMFQQESKTLVSTMNRDRLEQALDSGLDKAVYYMNSMNSVTITGNNSWDTIVSTGGFASLTCASTAYTDLNGVVYWVKVLKGKRVQPQSVTYTSVPSANPLSMTVADYNAEALTNTGDLNYDRTVIIMARAISTTAAKAGVVPNQMGVSLTAMAYLHRNDVQAVNQVGGISTNGTLDMSNWPATSFNSCNGSASMTAGCEGNISVGQGGGQNTGASCLPVQTPTAPFPPITLPGGTIKTWQIGDAPLASVTSNYTAPNGNAGPYYYSLTADEVWQVNNVDLGSLDFYITTNGHTLSVYVTGAFGGAGSPRWFVDDSLPVAPQYNNVTGGHPSRCWFYVIGSGAVTIGGNGIFEFVVVAPQSTVTKSGTADFYGAIVANDFNKNGSSGKFVFDACILQKYRANTYTNPPIVNAGWSQF